MKTCIYKAVSLLTAISLIAALGSSVSYAKEQSTAPKESNISVTNNTRARDTVYVCGLSGGDLVKVYSTENGTKVLGSGKVAIYNDDITISVSQLGISAGSIYVSVTSEDADESTRVKVDFDEETKSNDPMPEDITIENNAGMSDSVYVTGLTAGDVVKVYSTATGGKLLGSATMSSTKTEAQVRIGQLGSGGGSVFVSVTSVGERESNRVEVSFSAEPVSDNPSAENILITNNAGIADTVYVANLSAYDVVKVYNSENGGKMLGSATVTSNAVETTVKIKQLGAKGGSVYVSVTSKGYAESDRIKVDFLAETKSTAPGTDGITITNNPLGTADTVEIIGLSGGDVVKVYSEYKNGKLLGAITSGVNAYQATVSIPQIGASSGSVFITITSKGSSESDRIEVPYLAEPKSDAPSLANITVTNNAGASDTVIVAGISAGDIVRVYNAIKGGRLLGTATVSSNSSSATVTVSQLGTSSGTIYVSITNKGSNPSDRTAVDFTAESASSALSTSNIAITNNPVGTSDTIAVSSLNAGDTIKVYDAAKGGNQLGTATVPSGKTDATVTITQLGVSAGSVYISLTGKNKLESSRISVGYAAEASSSEPLANNVIITNNAGASDSIEVTGLSVNDTVYVYDCLKGGKALTSATVQSGKTSVTLTISQLGTSSGSVYISIASKGKNESSRVQFDYSAEEKTSDLNGNNIIITNNAGVADTIEITGISAGDIIYVYDSLKGGRLLGSGTVASGKTSVIISVTQLGASEGSVYVSSTSSNKLESNRLKVGYYAEAKTNAPAAENISVTNNPAGTSDTLAIIGLTAGDVINVYNADKGGTLLGTATVQSGKTFATVTIAQLGISVGKVYVTLTNTKKQESDRTEVSYVAEEKSKAPDSASVVVTNNPAGTADTVYVPGLSQGDIVNVYESETSDKVLATATVQGSSSSATVSIEQLGRYSGSVFVAVIGKNKLESDRVEVEYADEKQTNKPSAENIAIANNAGQADTVTVTGITAGDVVKVYSAASGGTLLGQATVANGSTSAVVEIEQLGAAAGSIHVSLTNKNKLESDRTEVSYDPESKTDAPAASKIYVTNNAGASDLVKVTGLTAGDVIKVYSAAAGGKLLGSGTVSTYKSDVSITIDQLGTAKGSIYVSATGSNYKLESDRTEVSYSAEPVSGTPDEANITITNNAGIADKVRVIGISAGDAVNVYDAAEGGNLLGTATAATGKTEATAEIDQLGSCEGKVYISLTCKNKLESARKEVSYSPESKSDGPDAQNIIIENYVGIASVITVSGLLGKDVVNVYDSESKSKLLGTGTVAEYYTDVAFEISQLGTAAGYVYVTVTSEGKLESDATKASYDAKPQAQAPDAKDVTIVNNAGIADIITVANLYEYDIVKVYSDSTKNELIGTATVEEGNSEVEIGITQIGTSAGSIYISIISLGTLESERIEVGFDAEKASTAPAAGNITVANNAGASGTVTVTGLAINDVVKVYDAATGGNLLGSITVTSLTTQAVVSIPQLGNTSGYVYVSVKSVGKTESSRTAASYSAVSAAPLESSVTIVNNVGISDTITVTGLSANDLVKVYDSSKAGTLLGKATSSGTQAVVSIAQLTTGTGTVYVTITSFGKSESARTAVDYSAEQSTPSPYQGSITITNNAVISDTVTVTGLQPNDVIKVYDLSSGGSVLGYATVASGSTQATVKISQLGTSAGTVYISVISLGKYESERTAVQYTAEQASTAPYEGNISIVNNTGSGTVTVTGLAGNDVVKVYDSEEGGNLLGQITVASTSTQAILTITQLNSNGGSVYISVTSTGKTESSRTKASYTAK